VRNGKPENRLPHKTGNTPQAERKKIVYKKKQWRPPSERKKIGKHLSPSNMKACHSVNISLMQSVAR
jgi:hypothetical protein